MLYPTCMTDDQWQVVSQLFHAFGYSDAGRKHPIRLIVDAIFYVVDNGIKWRGLPNDFPPWKTVYHHFNRWSREQIWESLNLNLVEITREKAGRERSPSLVSVDSQSLTAEPGVWGRGLDCNKKVNGRKRHIAVDVMGMLLSCVVMSANQHDRHAGEVITAQLNDDENFPRLEKILGDKAYRDVGISCRVPASIEADCRKEGEKGFVPQAFRWVVERSFAWLNRQRRLVRNYEK
ncbi:MAG: IS5 family transposase, partial [Oligoflexales bacterium]